MLFRLRVANGRPAPHALAKYATKHWRQDFRGYHEGSLPKIYQDRDARDYLRFRQAAGSCLAKDTILCKRSPSISTLCEELLHSMQLESGLYNYVAKDLKLGNAVAILVMEYLVAYILVKNEARWRILPLERKENRARLRRFSCTIVADIGGISWRLRSKLLASANSLGLKLESWMGSYLRVR